MAGGTEHEKFGFYTDGFAGPHDGPRGIRRLLELMEAPRLGAGHGPRRIIGLVDPIGRGAISLEPGGQFELSGAPSRPSTRPIAK